ncbi:hypothetical protein ACFVHB_20040 [Kitasatospora sp. NPDC127111]|uniref:hypothetical protein n=1 Tax=Kitasatospora sp. NPDC127111 TaxID=3345363 RepID=UPI0036281A35
MTDTTLTPVDAQEIEATGDYVAINLDGVPLRVLPVGQWRPSFLRALRTADFDGWAALALHPDDVATFVELDSTMDEIGDFTARAMSAAGEAPGKSGARSASSRTTRKR